jgi:UDP-N-acetylmuramate--alanine ligase
LEADEYDRSFLHLHPDIAVISAMDPDHLDIYGSDEEVKRSFTEFANNIKPDGILIARNGLKINLKQDIWRIDYAVEETIGVTAVNLHAENGRQVFDLVSGEKQFRNVTIGIPGRHNIENALAAYSVCVSLGVDPHEILRSISSFTGVRRRFDIRIQRPGIVYIDDYAHHPRELEAFITAVRQLYPGLKLTGMFQPHLYTRTRDFAAGFAESLDLLDEAWLLDIYPARELPIPGVTSAIIFNQMHLKDKQLISKEKALQLVASVKPEIFLTMGAGDIDLLVEPITKVLQP